MNSKTKMTLAELMRRKEQMLAAKKTKKTQDLYVKSIDSVITIKGKSRYGEPVMR